MNKLSIKIYPRNRDRAEFVLKTNSKTFKVKNLKEPADLKKRIKLLGASLEAGVRVQGMFTVRDTGKGVWLLDLDGRADVARVELWVKDFKWYGTPGALQKVIFVALALLIGVGGAFASKLFKRLFCFFCFHKNIAVFSILRF